MILVANTSWYLQNFQLRLMKELTARGVEVIALAPLDETSKRFEGLGVRYIELLMHRRGLNPIADCGLFIRLLRIYRKEKPDYAFHMTIKPVIYGSLAARFAGVPRWVNMVPGLGYVFIGDHLVHLALRPLVKAMYRLALSGSHRVFFQNPDDQRYFVENGLSAAAKTSVTYGSGVDLDHFSFVEPNLNTGVCSFILVGRMLWDKGVREFVEAARRVKDTHPTAQFQLLGRLDKDNPSHIDKHTIDEWIREGLVEYLGEVSDVRSAVQEADVVVLPSYREGVPKAILEALAMGKPVITTSAPGCRETVVHGRNGLMIPPRDIQALKEAILFMIGHPEKRAEMGKESRKLAAERFDVRNVNTMILETMDLS